MNARRYGVRCQALASIGPEVITSGNAPAQQTRQWRVRASIGPEVITSGNWTGGWTATPVNGGFNRAGSDHFRKCKRPHLGDAGKGSFNRAGSDHFRKWVTGRSQSESDEVLQ